AEELAELQPYMELAVRMGSLGCQLAGGKLRRVTCTYTGELAGRDTIVLTAEALRGLFAGFTETRINPINARSVAREHGVEVEERSRTRSRKDWANTIVLEVSGAQ